VPHLYAALHASLDALGRSYEILFVDDGSSDGTFAALTDVAETDPRVRLIRFRRNFGQTAAMVAGFDHARGDVVIPMDGDLQNDPADIPLLLQKIEEGYDVVSGWRKNRQDKALMRRFPSRIANWLIGRVTGVRLHDYGCSLKAYRAEVLHGTRLYGEMHRFIPALANLMGAKICEVPLRHHARKFGRSKYGMKRTLKVMLDLLTVKFLTDYSTKPIYFFGGIGLALCLGRHPGRGGDGLGEAGERHLRAQQSVHPHRRLPVHPRCQLRLPRPARRDHHSHLPRVAVQADLLDRRDAQSRGARVRRGRRARR
jgi:glycosyltransferase involved in cell wall biosynthesis